MKHHYDLKALCAQDYDAIAGQILEGAVVLYPTETTYGLGCHAANRAAVARIFALKGRPNTKPVLVLVRDLEMLREFVKEIPAPLEKLAKKFWPGPLTLVFEARGEKLPLDVLSPGLTTLAVRVSSHPFCKELFARIAEPIVSTSANLSTDPNPFAFSDVASSIREGVDASVDGGDLSKEAGGGKPSSIVRLEKGKLVLVREGALLAGELGIR